MAIWKWKRVGSAFFITLLALCIVSGLQLAEKAKARAGTSTQTNRTASVGTVTVSKLYVRETYNNASKIIGVLTKGMSAYIINNYQGWYKITFNSKTGWVYGAYLTDIHSLSASAYSTCGSSAPSSVSFSASSPLVPSLPTLNTAKNSPASAESHPDSTLPSRVAVGYYTNWSAYSGFAPDKINASSLNVVHYAFADIGKNLRISVDDPSIDYTNFAKLKALKKRYPHLKTLITIGGWDGSAEFSDMAFTDATRKAFAQSCVTFIKQYGFDGIDIDWEYPVSGGAAGRPEDKKNFTLLMQTLRSTLNAQSVIDGKYYYLTFAGGASDDYIDNVQLSRLAAYVDYAIDMTYDLHGPWDSYSDLNAPLYIPTGSSPQYKTSTDSSLRAWQSAGFPSRKLVMGVPFYGHIYIGVSSVNNGLYSRFTNAQTIGYDSIVSNYLSKGLLTSLFQPTAQVPTLFGGTTFISYDNASSIALKAQYSVLHGLRGVSAWELSYDKSSVLLTSMYNNLY